jgi:hypothetical protein
VCSLSVIRYFKGVFVSHMQTTNSSAVSSSSCIGTIFSTECVPRMNTPHTRPPEHNLVSTVMKVSKSGKAFRLHVSKNKKEFLVRARTPRTTTLCEGVRCHHSYVCAAHKSYSIYAFLHALSNSVRVT